jgi:hypothetical protein
MREIRRELAELGLDWDLPPYPPKDPREAGPFEWKSRQQSLDDPSRIFHLSFRATIRVDKKPHRRSRFVFFESSWPLFGTHVALRSEASNASSAGIATEFPGCR